MRWVISSVWQTQGRPDCGLGPEGRPNRPDVYIGIVSEDPEWLSRALLEYLCIGESANLSRVMWTVSNWSTLIMWRGASMWWSLMMSPVDQVQLLTRGSANEVTDDLDEQVKEHHEEVCVSRRYGLLNYNLEVSGIYCCHTEEKEYSCNRWEIRRINNITTS